MTMLDDNTVMTADEMAEAVAIKEMPQYWGGHVPEPPQQAFLWLPQKEGMYGGAAGGGKSDALLMGATQYVDVPGYAALLLRRQYKDLTKAGALIDRAKFWLANTDARWSEQQHAYFFPSGARVEFSYVAHINDLMQFQSAEYQYIGVDELTQWPERFYRFLFSRLRGPGKNCLNCNKSVSVSAPDVCPQCEGTEFSDPPLLAYVPLRMRAATNPGGPGHHWVKKRFIDNEDGNPDRVFIPASLWDNPHLDQEQYVDSLAALDEELREQLLNGDWDAREPGEWVIPDPTWVDAAVEYAEELLTDPDTGKPVEPPEPDRTPGLGEHNFGVPVLHVGIDWGEITQGYVIWPLENGGVYIPPSEVVARHKDPGATAIQILTTAMSFPYPLGCSRYDAAGVQSMRTYVSTAQKTFGIRKARTTKVAFSKYKKDGMGYLRMLFRRTAEGYNTQVIAIHPDNVELIRQLKRWERKDEETEDTTKVDDHGPDALLAGVAPIMARFRAAVKEAQEEMQEEEIEYAA